MNQQPKFCRTRLAPTPSGFLHLGNILSFAITAALARATGARILLRIDDLDRERTEAAYVQDIFDTLHFLEIPWDEGPRNYSEYEQEFSQLHRLPLYNDALQQLAAAGSVFACDCSRSRIAKLSPDGSYPGTCRYRGLPLEQPGTAWRLLTAAPRQLSVKTAEGIVTSSLPLPVKDFIVRKKDGFPAYHLASLADDTFYGVDLVVRGQDLWESTLAQHYLAAALGNGFFPAAVFHHHPLLMGGSHEKLSKSAGATSVQYLRKAGRSAADIYTMIAQMAGHEAPVKDYRQLGALFLPGAFTGHS